MVRKKGIATKHIVIAGTEAVDWALLYQDKGACTFPQQSPRMTDASPDKGRGIRRSLLAEQRGVEEHTFRDLLAVWL